MDVEFILFYLDITQSNYLNIEREVNGISKLKCYLILVYEFNL